MADKPSQGLPFEPPEQPRAQRPESTVASNELAIQLSAASRRLRVLEERYNNLHKKNQLTDQTVLNITKEFSKELKAVSAEMLDMKRDMEDLKDKFRLAIKELQECAKLEDVQLIKKYFDLFDFVKFATHHDVEKIVEMKLQELLPMEKAVR